MPENEIKPPDDPTSAQDHQLEAGNETVDSITAFDYADLYVLEVQAAAPPPPPQRPPAMKYKELPLYNSPHYEYKEYKEDERRCPKADCKLLQEWLLPYVKSYRRSFQETYGVVCSELNNMNKEIKSAIVGKKNDFKKYMRDPNNMEVRQAALVVGGLTGYYIGSSKGIPTRIAFSSLGILAAGALCFPKESEVAFKDFTYYTSKTFIAIYNKFCCKDFGLKERLPCKHDLPPPSKPVKLNKCPPTK